MSETVCGWSRVRWVIPVLTVGLSAWGLAVKNLWLDEAASWDMATSSLHRLVSATAADIHSPLYYLVLKGWMAFVGDSPAGLRSLSVAASLTTVLLMRRLAKGMLAGAVTVSALLWYAMSPQTVAYSQEARMYAPATAAVMGMCLAYRQWVESLYARRSALAVYAACATIALYLHYFTAVAIVAVWLHAALLARRQFDDASGQPRWPWRDWLIANGAIGALIAPWLRIAVGQVARGQPWRAPVTFGQLPHQAAELVGLMMFGVYRLPRPLSWPCLVVSAVLVAGMACTVIRARSDERDAFYALLALVPPFIGLAVMPIAGRLDLSRYMLYSTPLIIMATARGLGASPLPRWVVISVLAIASAMPLPSLKAYYDSRTKDYDVRPIVNYLVENARHGPSATQDTILIAPGYLSDPLRYVSRDALAYQRVETGEDLTRAAINARSGPQTIWCIVDYR